MQVSDNLISTLRVIRQGILNSGRTKMPTYLIPSSHDCKEASFLDKGYYRRHNGEIYPWEDEQKQDADFRALECEICHQEVLLLNTGMPNWDFVPNIVGKNDLGYSVCKK